RSVLPARPWQRFGIQGNGDLSHAVLRLSESTNNRDLESIANIPRREFALNQLKCTVQVVCRVPPLCKIVANIVYSCFSLREVVRSWSGYLGESHRRRRRS